MALFVREIVTSLVCIQGPSLPSCTQLLLQAQFPPCSLPGHALASACPSLSHGFPLLARVPPLLAESPLDTVQSESFTERNACCLLRVPEPLLAHHCLPSTVLRTLAISLKPQNSQAIQSRTVWL